jgi:hypothetical protein
MSQENNNKGYHYEIPVTYAVTMPVGENGAPVEVEKTETVKVLYLKRTNRAHSKLAMLLTKPGNDMETIADIAEKFVECAVDCEAKMKKDIKNDVFACMNIFQNETVQEDIEDFLLKLDFVRAAMNPPKD